MAAFNAKSFEKKLKQIDGSQTSIQTLSLWIIHHRSHANVISNAWLEYLRKATKPEKKLRLFYLANDVVQNGRKKAKELTNCFLNSFREALVLLGDPKIYSQVSRVLEIWIERKVFDQTTVADLKRIHELGQKVAGTKKVEKPVEKEKTVPVKVVPSDFKVSKLLVTIKKVTSLEYDLERKSKTLDNLKIDASSFDSVQHIKDRSSVGRFFKQFEESKIILDDYCHSLRRSEKEKKSLMNLLTGGEAFYDLAQDEAKVIVKAYETFGNRLHAMKKKLDSKIRKFEVEHPEEVERLRQKESHSGSNTSIHDDNMELESDSGDEIAESERYNPSTAPIHDTSEDNQDSIEQDSTIQENLAGNDVDYTSVSNDIATSLSSIDTNQAIKDETNILSSQSIGGHLQISTGMQSLIPSSESGFPMSSFHDVGNTITPGMQISLQPLIPPPKPPTESFNIIQSSLPFNAVAEHNGTQMIVNSQQVVTNPMVNQSSLQSSGEAQDGKVQNLIDSLFPMLSKSLQTIKEKQQSVIDENENRPSVSDAMAFALGENVNSANGEKQSAPRKKSRFSYSDPNLEDVSPVSLTNPKGLSNNQTELISIAAGITKFDENFLPVGSNNEPEIPADNSSHYKEESETRDKRKEDKKTSRKHKSHRDDDRHRRSSSRSPSRKHHRSRDSRDSRDEKLHRSSDSRDEKSYRSSRDDKHDGRRRSSRRSPSPRRRKSRSSRSSSVADRDDKDRNQSKDSKRRSSPYYNDRRSPTPEMDAQSLPIMETNSMNQQQFSVSSQEVTDQSQPNSISSVISMNNPTNVFPFQTKQPDISASNPMGIPSNVPDGNNVMGGQFNTQISANIPINHLQMGPPRLEFDSAGRPVLAPNLQIRPQNQLQMLSGTTIRGSVLHLRPLPPGYVPTSSRLLAPQQPNLLQPINNPFNGVQNPLNTIVNTIDTQSPNKQNKQDNETSNILGNQINTEMLQNEQIFDSEQKDIIESYLNSQSNENENLSKHNQFEVPMEKEIPNREFFPVSNGPSIPRSQTRIPLSDTYLQELELRNPISSGRPRFSSPQQVPRFRPRYGNGPRFRPRFRQNFPHRGNQRF